jgi:hypothetical protein
MPLLAKRAGLALKRVEASYKIKRNPANGASCAVASRGHPEGVVSGDRRRTGSLSHGLTRHVG